jgi:hypothetical protein
MPISKLGALRVLVPQKRRDRIRTCANYKKGLRERIAPMCTLSQNGYGDDMWST